MSSKTSLEAVDRLISRDSSSLLDRPDFSQVYSSLTETQALVDQTVSHSIDEIAKPETMIALLGAGAVSRLTRIGVMAAAPLQEGKVLFPLLARGGSYALALANESAAFTGIERGFGQWEGRPSTESFEKAWARSAISLGSLKFFGKVAEGQNIVLQHFSSDLGMVGAQNLGHVFGITDIPHGTLAEQMLQAEAMNWNMKGSLALLQGLSPNLFASERSLDLYLKNQETDLFPLGRSSPFFSQLAMAVEGRTEVFPTGFIKGEESKGPNIVKMSGSAEGGGSGKGSSDPTDRSVSSARDPAETIRELTELEALIKIATAKPGEVDTSVEGARVEIGSGSAEDQSSNFIYPPLEEALRGDQDPKIRARAAILLGKSGDPGVRSELERALQSETDDFVRDMIAMGLGFLRDPASRPVLENTLTSDEYPHVRAAAAIALGKIGDPAARSTLEKALVDPSEMVRGAVFGALDKLPGPRDRGRIRSLAELSPFSSGKKRGNLEEENPVIFPDAEVFEISLQQDQVTATLLSKRADQQGGMDLPAFIPEIHLDFAREVLEEKGTRGFFLKWKGDGPFPRGVKVLGHEIGSTQNGLVRNTEGTVIGVYDRIFGGGPKSETDQRVILYIEVPKD